MYNGSVVWFRLGNTQNASVLKWSTRGDCKSPDFGLRKFESFPAHKQTNGFGHFFVRRSEQNLYLRVGFERLFCILIIIKMRKVPGPVSGRIQAQKTPFREFFITLYKDLF